MTWTMLYCNLQIQLLSTMGGEQYEESGNHWETLPSIGKISITFWLLGSVEEEPHKRILLLVRSLPSAISDMVLCLIRVKHRCK